jgi:hypothetical protein
MTQRKSSISILREKEPEFSKKGGCLLALKAKIFIFWRFFYHYGRVKGEKCIFPVFLARLLLIY